MRIARILLAIILVSGAALLLRGGGTAVPTSALPLAPVACFGGATTAAAAFALPAESLRCDGNGLIPTERFVRARVDVRALPALPPGRLVWQTTPTAFDAMLIRFTYAGGDERLVDVDAQMAVRNWDANGMFRVPLAHGAQGLETIDVVVERPQFSMVFSRMNLSSPEDAARGNYRQTLLYVLLSGMLLIPIVYDLFFFRILRARFMLWHLVLSSATLVFVLTNAGLIFLLVPGMSLMLRFALTFIALATATLGLARFSSLVLEEGKLDRRIDRLLRWNCTITFVLAALVAADFEVLRVRVIYAFVISLAPFFVLLVALLMQAARRGSRAALFLIVAYTGLIVSGFAQIFAAFGLISSSSWLVDTVYFALIFSVLGTAAAVGDRFIIILAERDRARLSAKKLGAIANTDGLTGLRNRRAFDQYRHLAKGRALLLGDLDRFKDINDTHGHPCGDAVLRQAARVIEQVVARHGTGEVYRLGGEEFAVVCNCRDKGDARQLGEAIRRAVEAGADQPGAPALPPVTISIGGVMGGGQLMQMAFEQADEALYRAKAAGRNCCEFAPSA